MTWERAGAFLSRIPDFKRLFDARCRISTSSYLFDAKHRFDNHQSLINLRMESEFLTMLKSRNRLVLTLLEQHIFAASHERRQRLHISRQP